MNNSEVLKTSLEGLMRLEFYKDKGFVVVIQVAPTKYFFVKFDELQKIMADYELIVEAKTKKITQNGK